MGVELVFQVNTAWCTRAIYRFLPTFFLTLVTTATILISTPKNSFARYAAIPIVIYLCSWIREIGLLAFYQNPVGRMDWAATAYNVFLHQITLITLEQIDVNDPVISKPHDGQPPSYFVKLWRALSYTVNMRMINTPYQIRNVPAFDAKRPGWVPSRQEFLLKKTTQLIALYCFYDFLYTQDISEEDERKFLGVDKENILFRNPEDGPVTGDEIGYRIFTTLLMWMLMIPFTVMLQNAFWGVIAVGSGVSEPKSWPPVYGSVKDSYTLRLFWGKLWHQTLRYHLSKPASFLTHSVLRLPKNGLVQRYTNILFVFLLSGIMHAHQVYVTGGGRKFMLREIIFFSTMAFGIMVEDAVQWLFRSEKVRKGEEKEGFVLWKRIVGYIWVWGMVILVCPYIDYEKVRARLPTWFPIMLLRNGVDPLTYNPPPIVF